MRPRACRLFRGDALSATARWPASTRQAIGMPRTRPALSDERVQISVAGQVQLMLTTPWRDGTPHLVMSPLEFM